MPARSRTDQINTLYRYHAETLRRWVTASANADPDTIADACQIAWTKLLARPDVTTDPTTPPLGWLATVATRTVWELTRRERTRHEHEAAHATRAVPDPDADVDIIARLDQHSRAVQALATLTERQRRIVLLQAAGYSYPEIAAITGDTPRTVNRQLVRARERLRER